MQKHLGKGTIEFEMFQEYWKIYQAFHIVEDTDQYWQGLINTLNSFAKKYDKYAYRLAMAYLYLKDDEYQQKFKKGKNDYAKTLIHGAGKN